MLFCNFQKKFPNFSLEIEFKSDEKLLAIIGKSGSGKTTSVNQIGLLDRPSKGEIILDNKKISSLTDNQLAKFRGLKIGYIFQKFNLIKNLSAVENVELPMVFQGIEKEERYERAKKILEELEMGNRLENKPTELSGGQQQRIAIARALSNEPEIILADEPTAALDKERSVAVVKMLKQIAKEQNVAIVMVTHDEDMLPLCDKILKIHDKKVVSEKVSKNVNMI